MSERFDAVVIGAGPAGEVAAYRLAKQGHAVATARVSLPDAIARPWTYERDPRGELGIVADREREVLLGAWAVAPLAGPWGGSVQD